MEEYSVSMDGVRQDFVVAERPPGAGRTAGGAGGDRGARWKPMAGRRAAGAGAVRAQDRLQPVARHRCHGQGTAGADGGAGQLRTAALRTPKLALWPCWWTMRRRCIRVRIDPTFSDANWISMGGIPGANGDVYAAVVDGAGNLYIGGELYYRGRCHGQQHCQMEREQLVGPGVRDGRHGVYALAVSGSDLYAGAISRRRAAARPTTLPNGTGAVGRPWARGWTTAVCVRWRCRAATCMRGARSRRRAAAAANYIAKWNGSSWSALGSGMGGVSLTCVRWRCRAATCMSGGIFTTAGGIPANRIAKWNGSSWSALGSGMSRTSPTSRVMRWRCRAATCMRAAISRHAGGSEANDIAKWNGSSWSALGSGWGAGLTANLLT